MTEVAGQLADTQQAFDSVAADYDGPLGNNALVQGVRSRTLAAVMRSVPAGAALLDLGCGTGIDAVWLAERGYRVTAIDWSPAMVRRAQDRATRAAPAAAVEVQHLGIHELDQLPAHGFDAAYSDLGSLNCLPELAPAARAIARRLRKDGALIASVIGRVCPWELALCLRKGGWGRATVRWSKATVPVGLNGRTVWTRYYTPSEFRSAFEPAGFRLRSLRSLGLFVPPPYMLAFAQRHPRAVAALEAVEDRLAGWPGLRRWGDHFLVVMRQRG